MNKWFESKNLANYAKTALMQAQKKIDQVLDIKEDEIIGGVANKASTSSAAPFSLSPSSSDLPKLTLSSSKDGQTPHKDTSFIDSETESFFSSFIPSTTTASHSQAVSKNNTRNNSPSTLLLSNSSKEDKFKTIEQATDDFFKGNEFTEKLNSTPTIKKTPPKKENQRLSSDSSTNLSKPSLNDLHLNSKKSELIVNKPKSKSSTRINSTSSNISSSSSSSNFNLPASFSNNLSTSSNNLQNVSSTEHSDKQEWIQKYVDSTTENNSESMVEVKQAHNLNNQESSSKKKNLETSELIVISDTISQISSSSSSQLSNSTVVPVPALSSVTLKLNNDEENQSKCLNKVSNGDSNAIVKNEEESQSEQPSLDALSKEASEAVLNDMVKSIESNEVYKSLDSEEFSNLNSTIEEKEYNDALKASDKNEEAIEKQQNEATNIVSMFISSSSSVLLSNENENNDESYSNKNIKDKEIELAETSNEPTTSSDIDDSKSTNERNLNQNADPVTEKLPEAENFNEEKVKTSKNGSSSTNCSEDSEFVKVDSNGSGGSVGGGNYAFSMEGTSGNASSNEGEGLETCASSDIEVISLPSNNGDHKFTTSNNDSAFNKIPNRMMPLDSLNSKKSNQQTSSHPLNNNNSQLQAHSNNMHSQLIANSNVMQIFTNIKPTSIVSNSNEETPKETNNLSNDAANPTNKALLEAREAHILKLNRQNVKLQEDNDNLSNELERITYEANERVAQLQRTIIEINSKYENSCQTNDQSKRAFADMEKELNILRNMLQEKDAQIEQLTQEGTKLSKQELNHSNIIKKLRAKEKESEELLNSNRVELQKTNKELEELKKILDEKEELETRNIDILKKLEKTSFALEKELTITKSNLEDSEEKVKSLEKTLQNSFKELAELHKANAAKESKINEATSSIENQLKEEIQSAVEKERILANKKQESLKWELNSVRADITRIEQQHSLREEMLRKEIADLQKQLRDSENRNNELSQNISTVTRPLLRQIENLQQTHSNQVELLENAEKNLIERLKESQANLCEVSEKNRTNQEQIIDLNQKVKSYEMQIQSMKLEKSKLNAEYQLAKTNLDDYENKKLEMQAQHEVLVNSLNQQIENLTREKKYLESQLEIEIVKTEIETKKFQSMLNELTKERDLQQQLIKNKKQSELNDNLLRPQPNAATNMSGMSDKPSIQDIDHQMFQRSGALNILESLQSKLKQKDGEIVQLQKVVEGLEKTRESMAREIVNLTDKLDELKEKIVEFPELQDKYNKLNIEYNALLQLCGEKTEENEELRLDLMDVKEMYKLQIEDLIKRSNI